MLESWHCVMRQCVCLFSCFCVLFINTGLFSTWSWMPEFSVPRLPWVRMATKRHSRPTTSVTSIPLLFSLRQWSTRRRLESWLCLQRVTGRGERARRERGRREGVRERVRGGVTLVMERKEYCNYSHISLTTGFSISNRTAGDLLITAGDLILQ